MKFRVRLMLAILLVALPAVGLLFFFNYYISADLIETNYAKTVTESMALRAEQIDKDLRSVYQKTTELSVQKGLKRAVADYAALPRRKNEDVLRLSRYLSEQNSLPELVDAIFLYLPDTREIVCSQEYRSVISVADTEAYPWIGGGTPGGFAPWVQSDMGAGETNLIYLYAKPVYAADGELLATVALSVTERSLYYGLLDAQDSAQDYFLLTGDGRVCSARRMSAFGISIEELTGKGLPQTRVEVGDCRYHGEKNIYAVVRAPFSGLSLLCLTDRALLMQDMRQTQWLFCIVLLLIVLLIMQLSRGISQYLNRPLGELVGAMERVGAGDFETRTPVRREDEFNRLGTQFNDMVARIEELMQQVLAEQAHARQAELHALQYQIKPHFMYNTLNSIRFAAIMQGNEKIAEQLAAFIELLEASLNKTGDFIPLWQEIELLKDYTSLQRYRYMDCFTFTYEAAEEARACLVPRFLLQPLIENAILHGMDAKRGDNEIRVEARLIGGMLHIAVSDNGKGMTEDERDLLLRKNPDEKRQFNGIGVSNTVDRLRLFYGASMRFELYTAPGEGARYVIELPANRGTEGEDAP